MIPRGDRWADHLWDLSPVERRTRLTWKRDDLFAPDDAHGINGAKVRFLTHIIETASPVDGLLFGGSVHSPAVARVAAAGEHYDLPVLIVLGGTRHASAVRHPAVLDAARAGAAFTYIKVGYNPAIQARVDELSRERPTWLRVPYGIGPADDADDETLVGFHALGAYQVLNLPPTLTTLVVPFGTGNTAASILHGLATFDQCSDLQRIALIGLGPDRVEWLDRRLARLRSATGIDTAAVRELVEHTNVITSGWTTYARRTRYAVDGVAGHPHYEAKMLQFLDTTRPAWWDEGPDATAVWVIGS